MDTIKTDHMYKHYLIIKSTVKTPKEKITSEAAASADLQYASGQDEPLEIVIGGVSFLGTT